MISAFVGLAATGILTLASKHPEVPIVLEDELIPPLGLSKEQWMAFLRAAICGNPRTINRSFRLGTFGLTIRRLCDLGVMSNPRRMRFNGNPVFDADWRLPWTLDVFQRQPMQQYGLFEQSIVQYSKAPTVVESLGETVDGKAVTMSGALMLANRAGLSGMRSWIRSSNDRERYSHNTTAFFQKANAIF
jgi:hypothetical protein